MNCAKTAELIKMPFQIPSRVDPRNHIDGGTDSPWEGAILRGKGMPRNA